MALRNVKYVRVQDMTQKQREDLKIIDTKGLVAIETHNTEYKEVPVIIKKGIVNYIVNGD